MSERQLRDFARKVLDSPIGVTPSGWKAANKALSEPPDVVVLLRWLRKEHGANLLKEQGRESTSSKVLWAIITELQKTVRLTADGWKWVEEGRDEPQGNG